jgi:ribosomal protein L23
MNDSKIIDELGGTSAVAKLFEVKPASVSEWRTKGIPKARRQTLKLLRPDLFAVNAAKQQEAA